MAGVSRGARWGACLHRIKYALAGEFPLVKSDPFHSPLRAWIAFLVLAMPCALGLTCGGSMNTPLPPGPIGSTLGTATRLILDDAGFAPLDSSLVPNKVDVYDLGPVQPGDRVRVALEPPIGTLRPKTALLDFDGVLFTYFSGQGGAAGLQTVIDAVVTQATGKLFLCLANSAANNVTQSYTGSVEILRSQPIPAPPPQILLLNFAGGSIQLPEGNFTVMPFDAADIDATYAGLTDAIKSKIAEVVRENFEDTPVQVVTSDDPPPAGNFSTIEFGAFSATLFGISQDVDQENVECCDDAIVFTNDFDKAFAVQPTADGIATAIGNVAAHEAGHLLGLNHTSDITDLMDTTGSASTLLGDQDFKTANLHPNIFPFGKQDGPGMINRVVGP
ncbi:hypothetical protein RAS2_07040 [Phycisphaerae bacterium RAS2]|nr:hypothetical protein RAS2_07040 [Phycisphaerae bacterium RAS2]